MLSDFFYRNQLLKNNPLVDALAEVDKLLKLAVESTNENVVENIDNLSNRLCVTDLVCQMKCFDKLNSVVYMRIF